MLFAVSLVAVVQVAGLFLMLDAMRKAPLVRGEAASAQGGPRR